MTPSVLWSFSDHPAGVPVDAVPPVLDAIAETNDVTVERLRDPDRLLVIFGLLGGDPGPLTLNHIGE